MKFRLLQLCLRLIDMSENQSSSSQPNSQNINQAANMDGVSQLMNGGSAQQKALPSDLEPMDIWEAVDSPADLPTTDLPTVEQAIATTETKDAEGIAPTGVKTITRENELLALIHDLNECNDALLSRVATLEGELTQNQATARAEVEKARAAASVVQDTMKKQMTAEHASAQQVSQNAQQQVAKIVTQLETTEQALSRQRLINENLQTELDNSLERVAQLERECALSAQQHAEEAKARVKAETSSRDLRSRLQRQQRYTLQFKAALEKSLTVSARPVKAEVAHPVSFKDASSVAMPKVQRIMPWASAESSPFQGIDPHLETLIRNVGKPNTAEAVQPKARAPIHQPPVDKAPVNEVTTAKAPAAPEAEAELWQDLERVMSTASKTESVVRATEPLTDVAVEKPSEDEPAVAATEVTETFKTPRLNWQAQLKNVPAEGVGLEGDMPTAADLAPALPAEEPAEEPAEIPPAAVEASFAAATRQRLEQEVTFTEPSPWGKPVDQGNVPTDYLPATEGTTDSSVSPVVKPLRSQKKIGSLASVELPTFPSAKVGSFKR